MELKEWKELIDYFFNKFKESNFKGLFDDFWKEMIALHKDNDGAWTTVFIELAESLVKLKKS